MGLIKSSIKHILAAKQILTHNFAKEEKFKALILGYQDVCIAKSDADQLFGKEFVDAVKKCDGVRTKYYFNKKYQDEKDLVSLDVRDLFVRLGFEVDVLDLNIREGSEIYADLNDPIPESMYHQYHLIIDGGVTEHICDIFQGYVNIVHLLKIGGVVYHQVPLMWPNGGFFSINPVFFYSFYEANGFEVKSCNGVTLPCDTELRFPVESEKHFLPPLDIHALVRSEVEALAVKKMDVVEMKKPYQPIYDPEKRADPKLLKQYTSNELL